MGVCNCAMFCCTLLYVHSSIAIILIGKRELIALLNLSSWCLVMVERLFLAVPRGCLQFVIVVFPDHTHLLFLVGANPARPTSILGGGGIAKSSFTHACTCTCMHTHVLNIQTPMHAYTRMYACMHSLCNICLRTLKTHHPD